jgi:hypothetical protein
LSITVTTALILEIAGKRILINYGPGDFYKRT